MSKTGITKGALKLEDRSALSQVIHKFRLDHDWKQQELADAAGLPKEMIGALETIPKTKANRIGTLACTKLLDAGLDLKALISNLEVSDTRAKRTMKTKQPNLSLRLNVNKADALLKAALELTERAVQELNKNIHGLNKEIEGYEKQAEDLLTKAENLKARRTALLTKVSNSESSIGDINKNLRGEIHG